MTDLSDLHGFERFTRADLPPANAANGGHNGTGHGRGNGREPGHQPAEAPLLPIVAFEDLAARPRVPLHFLIDGLVPAGEAMLLSGKERTYKSFVTMEMSIAIASGRNFLGKHEVATATSVIMFDLENNRSRLCDRVEAALRREGLDNPALRRRLNVFDRENAPDRWRFDLRNIAALEHTLDVFAPGLVVIDNLRKATPAGKDEKDSKDMLPIMDMVIELCDVRGIALILAHHDRRDGSGTSGSGVLLSTPGNAVQIKHNRKTRISTVHCDSMRNAEPFEDFAVVMGRDGALRLTDVPDDEADDEQADYGGAVLDILSAGKAMTAKEIAVAADIPVAAARATLGRLVAAEFVVDLGYRTSDGRGKPPKQYGLAAAALI